MSTSPDVDRDAPEGPRIADRPARASGTSSPDLAEVRAYVVALVRPVLGWLLVAGGAAGLVVGWFGVSREVLVARQLPYVLSGGLGGVALVIVGAVLLAGNDQRRLAERLDQMDDRIADLHAVLLVEPHAAGAPSTNGRSPGTDGQTVAALPDGELHHDLDCPVVAGKDDVEHLSLAAARDRGLRACRLCTGGGDPE